MWTQCCGSGSGGCLSFWASRIRSRHQIRVWILRSTSKKQKKYREILIFTVLWLLKGSLTREFSTLGFFHESGPPGPWVFLWGRFKFFRKFAEIFANECLSLVSMKAAISWCHRFSVIAGAVDIGNKFIAGVLYSTVNNYRRSLWSGCVQCIWMQLFWRFQWHYRRLCPT